MSMNPSVVNQFMVRGIEQASGNAMLKQSLLRMWRLHRPVDATGWYEGDVMCNTCWEKSGDEFLPAGWPCETAKPLYELVTGYPYEG